jgi:hypothetical protein
MRVEVMKVAQQPAMAYDKISLNTAARSGKSGLLLKFLYAFLRQLWPCWERADTFSGRATCLRFLASAQTGPPTCSS